MALRTSHGRARQLGSVVSVELLPPDEQPPATPAEPGRSDRDTAGRFVAGNKIAKQARVRAGKRGTLAKLEGKGTPEWQAANKWGQQYAAHRLGELAKAHGGEVSSDVSVLVQDIGDAVADARWARAKAAELEAEGKHERAAALRAEARQLRLEARGHRLAAWELAHREAEARPKAADDNDFAAKAKALNGGRDA